MRKCKVCGSNRISWWHFYWKYGPEGAFYCKECGTVYKAIKRKGRLVMGEIVRKRTGTLDLLKKKEEAERKAKKLSMEEKMIREEALRQFRKCVKDLNRR